MTTTTTRRRFRCGAKPLTRGRRPPPPGKKPPVPVVPPGPWWLIRGTAAVAMALAVAMSWLHPRAAATPEDSVVRYLQALARADAATALSYAVEPPADRTFLNDDVLSATQARNPLTDIVVQPAAGCSKRATCQVVATFSLGGQSVRAPFSVTYSGGQYRLVDVASRVDLIAPARLTIEDRPVPGSTVALFPGVYRFGPANPLLTTDTTSFAVPYPDDTVAVAAPSFTLSPTGTSRLQAISADTLDQCLGERALFTSCGFGWGRLSGGATPDLNRLRWKYHAGAANTLRQAPFALAPGAAATATALVSIVLDIDVYDTAGVHYVDSMTLNRVSVDFDDPQAPAVTIEGVAWR